jgi:hypothetical protein
LANSFIMAMLALRSTESARLLLATMLAVASIASHALAPSHLIMGGIGMIERRLIGSAGLGYAKDRFAGEELRKGRSPHFEQYKAGELSKFSPVL